MVKAEMIPDKPDTDNTGVGMHGLMMLLSCLLFIQYKPCFYTAVVRKQGFFNLII
jgi:hypothetical protein